MYLSILINALSFLGQLVSQTRDACTTWSSWSQDNSRKMNINAKKPENF